MDQSLVCSNDNIVSVCSAEVKLKHFSYITHLWSCGMTNKTRSWIQVVIMRFLHRAAGLRFTEWCHHRAMRLELLLLLIERRQLRWF